MVGATRARWWMRSGRARSRRPKRSRDRSAAIEASQAQRGVLRRRGAGAREAAASADVNLPVRRRAHRREGARPGQGLAADRGLAGLQGPRVRLRRHHDGSPARRGRRAGGTDDRVGVRRHQLHLHPAARRHVEPLRPRTHARWVVGRVGRVGRRRPLPHLHRWRRRWLHPHPGRLHRPVRPEGDVRADPQGTAHRDRAADRGRRVRLALGARHGALVRRVQRRRRVRPLLAPPRRRLGGRAGPPGRPRHARRRLGRSGIRRRRDAPCAKRSRRPPTS